MSASEDHELIGVPGTPEIWAVGDGSYRIVYYVPGTNPPVPVAYTADKSAMQAIFGPDNEIVADREVTKDWIRNQGTLDFGSHEELANQTGDPIDALTDQMAKEANVRPWLNDPSVVQVLLEAVLEGRTPTAGEFANTTWWQEHNESERNWLLLNAEDPSTARQRLDDNRANARAQLISAGVWDPDDSLVNYVADKFTTGAWSQTYFANQILALADPASPMGMDAELKKFVKDGGIAVDKTAAGEDRVKQLVDQWLGPAMGQWSNKQVKDWAGRLRNDPDGEQLLISELQKQRMTLFPEYTDDTRTYDDIASSWRNVWTNQWGELPDETDSLFLDIVRMNDLGEAERTLRTKGLERGNTKTINDMVKTMTARFSGTQRAR